MSTARPPAPLSIDVVVADAAWLRAVPRARALVRQAVRAAAKGARRRRAGALSVALTSDRALRALNHDFRGRDKPTNVLSFAADGKPYLGDIALARATIAREARQQGKRLDHHLVHLVVHGTLHLLGYDHLKKTDAVRMEKLERAVLATLEIADPYVLAAPPRHAQKRKTAVLD